jgi:hypothetical protein
MLVADLIAENVKPLWSYAQFRKWSEEMVEMELDQSPEGAEALWECVVALWRLNMAGDEGEGEDEVWQQHVSAWLVS